MSWRRILICRHTFTEYDVQHYHWHFNSRLLDDKDNLHCVMDKIVSMSSYIHIKSELNIHAIHPSS